MSNINHRKIKRKMKIVVVIVVGTVVETVVDKNSTTKRNSNFFKLSLVNKNVFTYLIFSFNLKIKDNNGITRIIQ